MQVVSLLKFILSGLVMLNMLHTSLTWQEIFGSVKNIGRVCLLWPANLEFFDKKISLENSAYYEHTYTIYRVSRYVLHRPWQAVRLVRSCTFHDGLIPSSAYKAGSTCPQILFPWQY